ncbi:SPOR domain-containing protein [Treponema sp. C6A8]|uniref:SPOR domain-containing protein n=1 Tax=Treponema sp. C6A8 TaxID=1410609 RepID=UPI000485F53B|nr:SPOR domain-containing protein [Treponema sp. C6A8]
MKKTILAGLIFFASLTLCAAQETDAEEVSNNSSINIDEIAEELVSEEADAASDEIIEEEVVFDAEASDQALPENAGDALPDNFWRGKVALAASNEYPKGLFAMAKGYFPGDTLTVINGKNQASVNVLIIGSIEQSDAVGIKFSQEAAAALKISEQTDASVILDERINPPEVRENASAKLTVFGLDENDLAALEQPLSISDDQAILSKPVVVEEKAEESPEEVLEEGSETETAAEKEETPSELPEYIALPLDEITSDEVVDEAEIEANTANTSGQAYAPIILDLPESVEETAEYEEEIIEDVKKEEVCVIEDVKEEKEEEPAKEISQPAPVSQAASVVEKVEKGPRKEPVPYKKLIADEKMIRSGYYIQLAFLSNEENLENFARSYSRDLKLFFIPYKNGYKVFAGVFSEADKDIALDNIKKSGFKDAFVRKLGK